MSAFYGLPRRKSDGRVSVIPKLYSRGVAEEPSGVSAQAASLMLTFGLLPPGEVAGEITQASHEEMVVSLLEPSPLSKLLAQLATLEQTPEDERWPDGIWPDARAFADARTFIGRLPLPEIPLPEITLADDGEVNFFWKSDSVHVDLGFYGTGTCSYFARGKDGCRLYGDAAPASEGLPPEITALFTA